MTTTLQKPKTTTNDWIGCEDYGKCLSHVALAMAHGVTSNQYNHTMFNGNQLIIIARDGDKLFGFLAIATGKVVGTAGQYWPDYHHPNNHANQIVPVTYIHQIPTDLCGRLNQRGISTAYRADVATYLLKADRGCN